MTGPLSPQVADARCSAPENTLRSRVEEGLTVPLRSALRSTACGGDRPGLASEPPPLLQEGGRGPHDPAPASASLYRLRRQTVLRGTVNPSSGPAHTLRTAPFVQVSCRFVYTVGEQAERHHFLDPLIQPHPVATRVGEGFLGHHLLQGGFEGGSGHYCQLRLHFTGVAFAFPLDFLDNGEVSRGIHEADRIK